MSEAYTPQPIGSLVEFLVENNTHRVHLNPRGERCWGRICRLAYPFGWRHFYCDRPCCDQTGKRDEETGEELGRHHVKCVDDWTFTDYVYCIDCGQVGTIPIAKPARAEFDWPHQAESA